jgi:hypothetical protein
VHSSLSSLGRPGRARALLPPPRPARREAKKRKKQTSHPTWGKKESRILCLVQSDSILIRSQILQHQDITYQSFAFP